MLERPALPDTSRPSSGLHLPKRASLSPQAAQTSLIVLGIAVVTFIMYLYVLPNSQINAAQTRISGLRAEQAELQRQNSEVLQEIARLSDLTVLRARASQLGMGPVQSAIYLQMPSRQEGQEVEPSQPVVPAADSGLAPARQPVAPGAVEEQVRDLLERAGTWIDGSLSRLLGD